MEVDMKKIMVPLFIGAMAVGFLACGGCGNRSNPTSPKSTSNNGDGGGTQVTISGSAFGALTVAKGATVTWKNNDGMPHTATSDGTSAFPFDTGNIAPGATSNGIAFTQSGTFAYHCRIHSGMHGTIIVQ
jgi:plastocyanin